jgi:hypothetical protein
MEARYVKVKRGKVGGRLPSTSAGPGPALQKTLSNSTVGRAQARLTGFPYGNPRYGLPKRDDLRFEVLEKTL